MVSITRKSHSNTVKHIYTTNKVVRFNTRLTSLHNTSKTHISVFLSVIFGKFIVLYTKQLFSLLVSEFIFTLAGSNLV